MTNREKAIADFTEYLKALNTDGLADAINDTYYIDFCCKYCIYDDDGDCKTITDSCHNGIKKWLEKENEDGLEERF